MESDVSADDLSPERPPTDPSPAADSVEPADGPPTYFADMKLIAPLREAVERAGYTTATPVQREVIPLAMKGRDVVGQAQTGTGKTAAFLLPFMNRWRPHPLKG